MPTEMTQDPADDHLEHGRKLTAEEYERRTVALYEAGPPMPSRQEDLLLRRAELDLLVDYRLGTGFPLDRRSQLWEVQQALDKHRAWHLVRGFITKPGDPSVSIAAAQVKAFSKILDPIELRTFFDLRPDEIRSLVGS